MSTTERVRAASSGGNRRGRRSGFGSVRKLPSGRFQGRYTGPDGRQHTAPVTFDTKGDAETWLAMRRTAIVRGEWLPESAMKAKAAPVGFEEYARGWLERRDLKPRTRASYANLLERFLLPAFGGLAVAAITPRMVAEWHAGMGEDRPTTRARAYGLLAAMMNTAVAEDEIAASPCRVRGGQAVKRRVKIKPASLAELEAITAAMPERYRAAVMLTAWCALRFGELAELRRRDLDLKAAVLRIRRGVVRVNGQTVVDTPKTAAGARDVAIPPHLLPMLKDHIRDHVAFGKDALLFPAAGGGHLAPSTLYRVFYPARAAAGRPDLRWHDLRHTGAVLAAQSGATLAELMGRLGHTTPAAALRYQHVAEGRDAALAARLSALAGGGGA